MLLLLLLLKQSDTSYLSVFSKNLKQRLQQIYFEYHSTSLPVNDAKIQTLTPTKAVTHLID
jgi:hypothetical protein